MNVIAAIVCSLLGIVDLQLAQSMWGNFHYTGYELSWILLWELKLFPQKLRLLSAGSSDTKSHCRNERFFFPCKHITNKKLQLIWKRSTVSGVNEYQATGCILKLDPNVARSDLSLQFSDVINTIHRYCNFHRGKEYADAHYHSELSKKHSFQWLRRKLFPESVFLLCSWIKWKMYVIKFLCYSLSVLF